MRGRMIPLSLPRRMVLDLLYFARGVPTVPVPPALWLLGSALVGLVGVSRRKREAADEGLMA